MIIIIIIIIIFHSPRGAVLAQFVQRNEAINYKIVKVSFKSSTAGIKVCALLRAGRNVAFARKCDPVQK